MSVNKSILSKTRNPLLPDEMLSQSAYDEILKVDPTYFGLDAKGVEQQQQNIRKNIPLSLGMAQPTSMPRSMSMSIPSIEEPQQEDSTNFLGSLLSQGAAMLGAGVRGGDVGQVGRMFDLNRQESFRQGQYQKQKAEQKQKIKEQENTARQYVDPNSEISIQERAKAEELYPFPIPKNLSYADINNDKVMKALQAKYNATQEQKSLEEQKGLQGRLDDPNSEESKKLMESLIKLRINVPKGLSANEMQKYYPRLVELSKSQPMIGGGGVRGGGVRQEKPEKESKEQKDLDEYTSQAEALKRQLEDYRKVLKQIPVLGGAAIKEKAKTLGKGLLLKMKTVEKTGSLDQGSIDVIEGIIGTPDYTRPEVVDSKIDQALLNINRNVEFETMGKNGLNRKYKPFIPFKANEQENQIINNYFNNPNDPNYSKLYNDLINKKGF